MTNLEIMKTKLHENVIAGLLEQGFVGKWPHFKRVQQRHTELITFQTNKYGGSFKVEMSVVFQDAKDKNYCKIDGKPFSLDTVNVWDTKQRYRLKGVNGGWFYYSDLYRRRVLFRSSYVDVSEKEADGFLPPKGYELVQRFNAETAEKICRCVNRQMRGGFAWIRRFVNSQRKKNDNKKVTKR